MKDMMTYKEWQLYALDSRCVAINPQLGKRLMLLYTLNGQAGSSSLCGFT